MLDINFIRENPEKVKKGIAAKGCDVGLVDQALKLDEEKRSLIKKIEELRAKRNEITESMSPSPSPSPSPSENDDEALRSQKADQGRKVKDGIRQLEPELKTVEEKLKNLLYQIPNLPTDDVPVGDEFCKKVLRKIGKPSKFDFLPKDHVELGEVLSIIDIPRAAKISGTRFAYLKNEAVLLEFALVQFALQKLTKEGFAPVLPPMLIKKEITNGLGYWHGGGNENYYFVKDYEKIKQGKERELDLYLVGTGEHSVVPMHSGEVLEEKDLPRRYVAFSSCFRREAGSYGKDTRGILRVHQFDKVEMVSITTPEEDEKEHLKLLSYSEMLVKELGLSYQVVKLASGDMGFPTAKTYDIETWIPSQNKYRETHSISTTTDYQARRLDIKYRTKSGNKYVHILNGTALAIGRTIIAILENYQQKDGSVLVPKILRKYCGFEKISPRK